MHFQPTLSPPPTHTSLASFFFHCIPTFVLALKKNIVNFAFMLFLFLSYCIKPSSPYPHQCIASNKYKLRERENHIIFVSVYPCTKDKGPVHPESRTCTKDEISVTPKERGPWFSPNDNFQNRLFTIIN